MASELVIMPLGADEPKASSNLRFCSVRWMSLRVSVSLCEKWRRAGLCVWSLSAEPIGEGFTRRHEGTELGFCAVDESPRLRVRNGVVLVCVSGH